MTTRKETGLEVNAEKTKCMVMSQNQCAGQNHNIQIGNKSSEKVEYLKYLGTILTDQNSIHDETKSKLKPRNAYHHSVQNLLSCSLLSKNAVELIWIMVIWISLVLGVNLILHS